LSVISGQWSVGVLVYFVLVTCYFVLYRYFVPAEKLVIRLEAGIARWFKIGFQEFVGTALRRRQRPPLNGSNPVFQQATATPTCGNDCDGPRASPQSTAGSPLADGIGLISVYPRKSAANNQLAFPAQTVIADSSLGPVSPPD
jgi:hypothetical protein